MVTTQTITKAKMLEMYARKTIEDPIIVNAKLYARTVEGQADNPDGYIVVVCDV